MPKITIKNSSSVEQTVKVVSGDLVLINEDPYIAAYTNSNGLELINLADGNRWTNGTLKEKSSEFELQEFIGRKFKVELIKSNNYEIQISMK
ncbi:hypothetical protein D3C87_624620 [compost metagenome]